MAVEVREVYYYILQGSALDPKTAAFSQHLNYYLVSGFNGSNAVATDLVYANEYTPYVISGGDPGLPNVYVINHSWFIIDGGFADSDRIVAERMGLWTINGDAQPTEVVANFTGVWVITDN